MEPVRVNIGVYRLDPRRTSRSRLVDNVVCRGPIVSRGRLTGVGYTQMSVEGRWCRRGRVETTIREPVPVEVWWNSRVYVSSRNGREGAVVPTHSRGTVGSGVYEFVPLDRSDGDDRFCPCVYGSRDREVRRWRRLHVRTYLRSSGRCWPQSSLLDTELARYRRWPRSRSYLWPLVLGGYGTATSLVHVLVTWDEDDEGVVSFTRTWGDVTVLTTVYVRSCLVGRSWDHFRNRPC